MEVLGRMNFLDHGSQSVRNPAGRKEETSLLDSKRGEVKLGSHEFKLIVCVQKFGFINGLIM